jgi:uncharacterized NAD(P)/FAD-binding protein YdhS
MTNDTLERLTVGFSGEFADLAALLRQRVDPTLNLAVIGGGPSAAGVVEAVARHIAPVTQVDMTVFEPGPNLWRGRVFQRDGDEVLANVPMVEMSARAWDREHGARWLREHGLGRLAAETTFPSRSLVGLYLQDSAGRALAAMQAVGSRARVQARAARALVRDEGQLWARGEGWQTGPFDHAVLCRGAPPSYDHYHLASFQVLYDHIASLQPDFLDE